MGNRKIFQSEEERVICEQIMKNFYKKYFSSQRNVNTEIKEILTNDFSDKLKKNQILGMENKNYKLLRPMNSNQALNRGYKIPWDEIGNEKVWGWEVKYENGEIGWIPEDKDETTD